MKKNGTYDSDNEKIAFDKAMDTVAALLSDDEKFASSFLQLNKINDDIKGAKKHNNIEKRILTLGRVVSQIDENIDLLKQLRANFFLKDQLRDKVQERKSPITTNIAKTKNQRNDSIENQAQKKLLSRAANNFLSKDELQKAKTNHASIIPTLDLIIDKVEKKIDKIKALFDESKTVEYKTKVSISKSEQIDASRKEIALGDIGGDILGKLTSDIVQRLGEAMEGLPKKFTPKERKINADEVDRKFDRTISKMTNVRQEIEEKFGKEKEIVQLMRLNPPETEKKKNTSISLNI